MILHVGIGDATGFTWPAGTIPPAPQGVTTFTWPTAAEKTAYAQYQAGQAQAAASSPAAPTSSGTISILGFDVKPEYLAYGMIGVLLLSMAKRR